ncbi:MAG: holo-ACP synthase [Dehalococcoidales bacterium]|nr:holo-ACP synthase [Dehalococcoidales bacterium]
MHRVGIDIIEIARIEKAITNRGANFLHRIYTRAELDHYQGKTSSLAARFAAKEAVMKALTEQTGVFNWREIEILSDSTGKPVVHLYGRAQRQATRLGLKGLAISLSHSREYAIACVIGEPD